MNGSFRAPAELGRPPIPAAIGIVAAAVVVLSIPFALMVLIVASAAAGMWWVDPATVPQSTSVTVLAAGLVPVLIGCVIARSLWTGKGWARLVAQVLFGIEAASLCANTLFPRYPGASAADAFWTLIGLGCAAAAIYLERPHVRAAYGLEPRGVIARNSPASVALVLGLALLAMIGLR